MTAFRTPWEADPAPESSPAPEPDVARPPKPRGRRRAKPRSDAASAACLYHHLTITGPVDGVQDFAAAARGAGITPWASDSTAVEDYAFNLAASQPPALRSLSIEGCRRLARQFRERFEAHHGRAAERVGRSRVCPFDLHALLPVPETVLRLGPTDRAAMAWMAENWGTDDLLQPTERPDAGPGRRLPKGHAVIGIGSGGIASGRTILSRPPNRT